MKIAIIDYLGGPYDGSTIEKRGLGGSESAVILVSRELVKLGFTVHVYNDCSSEDAIPGEYDAVSYIPIAQLTPNRYDVVISSRTSKPFKDNIIDAKYKVLWLHDTFCGDEKDIEQMLLSGEISDLWTLSDYATNLNVNMTHNIKPRLFETMKKHVWVTRNGAHKWIKEIDIKQKDKNKFIYNASSIKGLSPLLDDVWPRIKKKLPNAKLTIVGGYYTGTNPGGQFEIVNNYMNNENIKELDVSFTGVISQKEVAEHFASAYMFLYPSSLPETFGISTLESLLYNTPLITNDFGALEETALESCCYKISYPIESNMHFDNVDRDDQIEKFVNTVLEVYNNEYEYMQKQNACDIVKDPDIYSWESIAIQWKQRIYFKTGVFLDKETFKRATKINDKYHRIFKRRYLNEEHAKVFRKNNIEKRIVVISPFWNAENYIQKCILSVAQQDYENYLHILIDDNSDDKSYQVAAYTIETLPKSIQSKFLLTRNDENVGCIANQLKMFNHVKDDDIVMLLDGDDWLTNNNTIFNFYNETYYDGHDFTYGSTYSLAGKINLIAQTYPDQVINNNAYRNHQFNWGIPYTHLRTFSGSLCKNLDENVFKDSSGQFMKAGADNPLFYELIEKSQNPLAVKEVLHHYNDMNPLNDYKIRSEEQNINAYGNDNIMNTNEKKKILIALPTAKYIEPMTFHSIYNLIIPEGYETELVFFYGYQIDQIRNMIANYALGYDYLFSVDSDIILPNDTLVKMLNAKKDIISGMYVQRRNNAHTVEIFRRTEDGGIWQWPYYEMPDEDVFEIEACGFGCVLVNCDVLRAMDHPWFLYKHNIDRSQVTSEDVYFAIKAKEKGFTLWCDKSIKCSHIGETYFEVLGKDFAEANVRAKQAKYNCGEHKSFLESLGYTPNVCYDVGSGLLHWHYGLQHAHPTCSNFLIDASSTAEKIYRENKLTYERSVVSDRVKQVNYYENNFNIVGDSYYMETSGAYQEVHASRVTTNTIDNIARENNWPKPDIMKIDIQGAEIDALKGATETLSHCKDVVLSVQFTEYNKGAPLAKDVLDYMESIGYKFVRDYERGEIDGMYHFAKI